jgi:hypothetical protein
LSSSVVFGRRRRSSRLLLTRWLLGILEVFSPFELACGFFEVGLGDLVARFVLDGVAVGGDGPVVVFQKVQGLAQPGVRLAKGRGESNGPSSVGGGGLVPL